MSQRNWWDKRMLAIDIDTTGLSTQKDNIIRVCLVAVGGNSETQKYSWLINPKNTVLTPEVAKFNGLNQNLLEEKGQEIEEVLAHVFKLLFANPEQAIVAFNAKFIFQFLFAEAERLNWVDSMESLKELKRIIDPFVIDKWMFPYRSGSRKLPDVCQHYTIQHQVEDEFSKCLNSARLAWKMMNMKHIHEHINNNEQYEQQIFWDTTKLDIRKLFQSQHQWAYYQSMNLSEYYTRNNIKNDCVVENNWPF